MEIGLLSPSAWEGVGIVAFLVTMFLLHIVAVARGWIVWGPAHREIVRAKDESIAHFSGREAEDQSTIATLVKTVAEGKVANELSAHMMMAIRDAAASHSNGGDRS